jgi:hypothetical protein
MPPAIIAGGIAAAGTIGGAVLSSSSQKKAAKSAAPPRPTPRTTISPWPAFPGAEPGQPSAVPQLRLWVERLINSFLFGPQAGGKWGQAQGPAHQRDRTGTATCKPIPTSPLKPSALPQTASSRLPALLHNGIIRTTDRPKGDRFRRSAAETTRSPAQRPEWTPTRPSPIARSTSSRFRRGCASSTPA